MSDNRLSAELDVNVDGVSSGAGRAVSSLQAIQAEMVKTQDALNKAVDGSSIDRLNTKLSNLQKNFDVLSGKGGMSGIATPINKASDAARELSTTMISAGDNSTALSRIMNRNLHGVADLFIAPGRAALIFANDLPPLIERFKEMKAEQAALKAEGKAAASTTDLLAQAFNPLGLAVSLGAIALIHYVPKLVEYITETKGAAKAQKELDDALSKDSGFKSAISNVARLTEEVGLAKQGLISKKKVVDDYNSTMGKTAGVVGDLNEVEQSLIDNGAAYIEVTKQKAIATAAYANWAQGVIDSQKKIRDAQRDASQAITAFREIYKDDPARMKRNLDKVESDFKSTIDSIKKDAKDNDLFKEWGDNAEKAMAKISASKGFNFFGDNKGSKATKSTIDAITELNNSFADIDRQASNHLIHLSDVAKMRLDAVNKAIDKITKGGGNADSLADLKRHLETDLSNSDVITIKSPKVKYEKPKIDDKATTGILSQIQKDKKLVDDAFDDWRKAAAKKQEINIEVEVGATTNLEAARRAIQIDRQYIIKLLNELNDPAISEAARRSLQEALDRAYSQLNADSAKERLEEINEIIGNFVKDMSSTGLTDIGEIIGTSIGGGKMPDLFKSLKTELGSQVENFGKQLIAWGTAIALAKSTFLKSLITNPWVAIGAGVALVALGAAIKASVQDGGGATSSGSSVSSTPQNNFYAPSSPSYSGTTASYSGGDSVSGGLANQIKEIPVNVSVDGKIENNVIRLANIKAQNDYNR